MEMGQTSDEGTTDHFFEATAAQPDLHCCKHPNVLL